MPKDPAEALAPQIEALLQPGEALQGSVIATEQSTFSGSMVVLAVTDQRLILQKFDRKLRPKDDPTAIRPSELARVSSDGAGHGWWTATASIMDGAALELRLETTGGEKRTVTMMRGGGGMFGKLGGGESQQAGIDALAAWLTAADPST